MQPQFWEDYKCTTVDTLSYKTISANKETANRQWMLIDAEGQKLGRVSTQIAKILRGKHKPNFTPHADCGDYVVVVNAEKVDLTGNKLEDKKYIRHTGYPGGQRETSAELLLQKHPERLIESAVRGMLPKNKLGRAIFKNMKVYVGSEHPHDAQNPTKIDLSTFK